MKKKKANPHQVDAIVMCPYPLQGDNGTIDDCVAKGHCACSVGGKIRMENMAEYYEERDADNYLDSLSSYT